MKFTKLKNIYITGLGSYLPKKVVKNDELPQELNTNDEWITQRTGIRQRHISNDEEDSSYMSTIASKEAIKESNLNPEEIDLIIVATTTPNKIFPSVAAQVQGKLGCKNAFCFDIQAVCSGFLYGYYTAINIMSGDAKIKNAIVIGSEQMSKILDWGDRNTSVLFGDGAGAVVLRKQKVDQNIEENNINKEHYGINNINIKSHGKEIKDENGMTAKMNTISCNKNLNENNEVDYIAQAQRGYIDGILKTEGTFTDILYANHNEYLKMDGKKVFVKAITELEKIIREICEKNNVNLHEIDHFVIHQANIRIINHLSSSLNINNNKFLTTIDIHANTSAASIPLLLNHYKDKFNSGDLILLAAIGGGMTWGAILIKW